MKCGTTLKGVIVFLVLLISVSFQTPNLLTSYETNFIEVSTNIKPNQTPPLDLPFFPLGIYAVQNSNDIWESWNNWFNTVILGFSEPEDFELPIEDMLLTCDVLGMRVLFDTSYFLRRNALSDLMDIGLSVVDHPSIYAWYIVDEPGLGANGTFIDENMIQVAVETIHRIDTRPTFVQFSLLAINESLWEKSFDAVPDFVDIISVDPYPNMPYTNHNIVTDWVETILKYNAGRAKVWAVLTAQDFSQSLGESGFDIPTEAEYMMDAVLALQLGVGGLLWFAFSEITPVDFGAHAFPASWAALGRVVRRISQVVQILVGRENEMQPVPICEKLEAAYAKRGSQTVLLLANHDYYWNGTETSWRLHPITITIEAQDVVAVSRIEPFGPVPLDFKVTRSFISFNVTVEGGMILLIESSVPIALPELGSNAVTLLPSLLMLIAIVRLLWLHKHTIHRFQTFRKVKLR